MKKQMGKPKVKKWKFNHKDYSWMKEINYFLKNIRRNLKSESNILNANYGSNKLDFDATSLSSGIYFYSIGNKNQLITKKMIVNKN